MRGTFSESSVYHSWKLVSHLLWILRNYLGVVNSAANNLFNLRIVKDLGTRTVIYFQKPCKVINLNQIDFFPKIYNSAREVRHPHCTLLNGCMYYINSAKKIQFMTRIERMGDMFKHFHSQHTSTTTQRGKQNDHLPDNKMFSLWLRPIQSLFATSWRPYTPAFWTGLCIQNEKSSDGRCVGQKNLPYAGKVFMVH